MVVFGSLVAIYWKEFVEFVILGYNKLSHDHRFIIIILPKSICCVIIIIIKGIQCKNCSRMCNQWEFPLSKKNIAICFGVSLFIAFIGQCLEYTYTYV